LLGFDEWRKGIVREGESERGREWEMARVGEWEHFSDSL